MSEEKHHHHHCHHHKEEEQPAEDVFYSHQPAGDESGSEKLDDSEQFVDDTIDDDMVSGHMDYSELPTKVSYSNDHLAMETSYSESPPDDESYSSKNTTLKLPNSTSDDYDNYKKEEKQHKHREHLGEMGALASGAFALYEKHEAKKDPENAHRHKIVEEVAAAVAVGSGGYAFHEHHQKKEAEEEAEEASGKKHHHLF